MDIPKFVPTPEEALEMISGIQAQLHPAFEQALFEATNYIETKKLSCDHNTLYMLIRLHVKNYLVRLGIDGVEFDELSLCGLSFKESGANWRIWKAEDHELPSPGSSDERRKFYNQQYVLDLNGQPEIPKLKRFAILWNLDFKNRVTLWLVCPKYYDDEKRKADSRWHVLIPNPALTMKVDGDIGKLTADLPMEAKK